MKKQLKKIGTLIGIVATLGAALAITIPVGDYMEVWNAQNIYDWLMIKKETLLSLGTSGTAVSIMFIVFRHIFLMIKENRNDVLSTEKRILEDNRITREQNDKNSNMVGEFLKLIYSQLLIQSKYHTIMSKKNLDSPVLKDIDKEDIKKLIDEIRINSYEESKILVDLNENMDFNIGNISNIINTANDIIRIVDTLKGDE